MANNNTNTTATKEKKNGAFINHYPKAMCHKQHGVTQKGEDIEFYSVSIDWPESKSGKATIALFESQLLPATKKNKKTGKIYVVKDRWNLFLGGADEENELSICTKYAKNKENRKYAAKQYKNSYIAKTVNKCRTAYAEEHAADANA